MPNDIYQWEAGGGLGKSTSLRTLCISLLRMLTYRNSTPLSHLLQAAHDASNKDAVLGRTRGVVQALSHTTIQER